LRIWEGHPGPVGDGLPLAFADGVYMATDYACEALG